MEEIANTLLMLKVLGRSISIKNKVKKITIKSIKLLDLIFHIITNGIIFWIVDNKKRMFKELIFKIEINQE